MSKTFGRYLVEKDGFLEIDPAKVERDARYDGKWVLRTNAELTPVEGARLYKKEVGIDIVATQYPPRHTLIGPGMLSGGRSSGHERRRLRSVRSRSRSLASAAMTHRPFRPPSCRARTQPR